MMNLVKLVLRLMARVAELERKVASIGRYGTVHSRDPAKHRIRLKLGEGADGSLFLTPWIPYAQLAGKLKFHAMPSEGQQMALFCPNGDYRQAMAFPMTWTDQNPSPSSNGDENVATFGHLRAEIREGDVKLSTPKLVIEAGGGTITAEGGMLKFSGFDRLEHAGLNIGKDHTHGGIERGGADTDPPNP